METPPPVKQQSAIRFGVPASGYSGFPVFRLSYDCFVHVGPWTPSWEPYFMSGECEILRSLYLSLAFF